MSGERVTAECPVEQCRGTIRLSTSLPAGEYACICNAALLRLAWDTAANFQRSPRLSIASRGLREVLDQADP